VFTTLPTLTAIATSGAMAQTVEREGAKPESKLQLGGAALQLNGLGVRTRAIFKVDVAGLYVPTRRSSAAAVLAQTGPHSEAQLAALKPQIDAFNAALKAIGEASGFCGRSGAKPRR
jgi:hypothetical protein